MSYNCDFRKNDLSVIQADMLAAGIIIPLLRTGVVLRMRTASFTDGILFLCFVEMLAMIQLVNLG